MSHPESSPYRIHVRDISRAPGAHKTVHESFSAPERLGTSLIGVPAGADVELDMSLESLSEGVWVTGTVTAEAVGECGRCLDEVRVDEPVQVQGLFAYPDASADDGEESDAQDVFEFDGETVDLEGAVRDAVVTSLPFTPLCRPDCPGLCDQCGARLADDPDHAHEVIDPRWSALQSLTEQKES